MSKRIANFGGVGGQPSPYTPGSSPSFKGGPSGGGVNEFGADESLDTLMSRSHKPGIFGFERSMASILEAFHDGIEQDSEPYLLTFDERIKLDIKKKIRNKEEYLKELRNKENQIEINDVSEKIQKRLETVEDMLEYFRKNTHVDFSKNASRKADTSYYRRPSSLPLNDDFLATTDEYDDDSNPINLTKNRLTFAPTGNTPQYRPEDGVDKYIEENNSKNLPWMHQQFEGLINTGDIGYEDFNTSTLETSSINDGGSPITPESKDNNLSIEQRIEKMKPASEGIGRLDPSMTKTIDWDEKLRGKYPERGVSKISPYWNTEFNDSSKNDIPQTSNNPYNTVMR